MTAQISRDDLLMQTLVWLNMVWFRVIQFGTFWLDTSYMNLRQSHIWKHQI